MPLYAYACESCDLGFDKVNLIEERHTGAPSCECGAVMKLTISPVRGFVKFPAAGGHEYRSPVSGRPITTERARRDDLARTGSRPYEGFAAESKEAAKFRAHEEKKSDAKLHESVSRAYYQLSPEKRKVLNG